MNGVNYEPLLRDMTWSFSRLSSYAQCPNQWYLHYLMEEPEEEQFYASYGSFCHELIARYYTGELTSDELLPEFLQGFCNRVQGLRPSREIEQKYLDQGAFYFEHFEPFPLSTLEVEREIELDIDGLKFTGIIDYLGQTLQESNADSPPALILIDHKSADIKPYSKRHQTKPTKTDMELDEKLRQLYLYAIWVHEEYSRWPSELWFNCFRTGKIIKEQFDIQKAREAKDWVKRQVERIYKEDLFLPTDDFYYCKWVCGQHNNCELYEEEYMGRRR